MRTRLAVVLILIVISPLVIAGWLGARIVRDERALVEHRTRALVLGQLRGVAGDLEETLRRYADDVTARMQVESESIEAVVNRALASPYVSQYFRIDANGTMLHPALDDPGSLTEAERSALTRTRQIWDGGALRATAEEIRSAGRDAGRTSYLASPGSESEVRWHSWYWGEGLHWILWFPSPSGIVHAFELDRARLLSEIVASLPDTDPEGTGIGGRLKLRDAASRTLYQWGEYEPPDDSVPLATLTLEHPVAVWALEFHAPEGALGSVAAGGVVLNLVAGMLLLGLAVLGSGVWFYREHTRSMRDAAQRVSFVNQVSHELKTPLTNIRMYAELLEEHVPPDDERSRRFAGIVAAESRRLSRLIGNILTFSRQQRSGLEIHRRSAVVDDVVRSCLDHFRPALEAKGIVVECDLRAGERASFDPDALEQILGNLIGNVEKYAAEGRKMDVRTEQRGREVEVLISDAGRGVPARERERIFQPFYRVENTLTEGVAGTGIGLSIARDLAHLQGGDLTVVPVDAGACFRLTLDCPPVAGEET